LAVWDIQRAKMVRDMYVMGIDIGGSSTKCVILDAYQTICGKSLAVGGDEKETAARAIRKALADAEIDEEDLYFTAATPRDTGTGICRRPTALFPNLSVMRSGRTGSGRRRAR